MAKKKDFSIGGDIPKPMTAKAQETVSREAKVDIPVSDGSIQTFDFSNHCGQGFDDTVYALVHVIRQMVDANVSASTVNCRRTRKGISRKLKRLYQPVGDEAPQKGRCLGVRCAASVRGPALARLCNSCCEPSYVVVHKLSIDIPESRRPPTLGSLVGEAQKTSKAGCNS